MPSDDSMKKSPAATFRSQQLSNRDIDIGLFIAEHPVTDVNELIEILILHLRSKWMRGIRQTAESYLAAYPQIQEESEGWIDLVYSEYLCRRQLDEHIDDNKFVERFPEIQEALKAQIQLNRVLEQSTISSRLNSPSGRSSQFAGADAPSEDILIGTTFGRYQIERLLGRGGMGSVYLAKDDTLHRHVALKFPTHALTDDEVVIKRFYLEARAAARLSHPNIASVYDAGSFQGIHFLSMEYVEGTTLESRIVERGKLDSSEAVRCIIEITKATAYAHENGIVHRDIKPGNIMLKANDFPVVTDFGLAQMQQSGDQSSLYSTGTFRGTPAFASPEQINGNKVGEASDYYSLGAVLFYMLTGTLPFKGSLMELFNKILREQPPAPSSFDKRIPLKLDQITQRLLAKIPEDRYSSPSDLISELESVWSHHAEVSTTSITVKPVAMNSKRHSHHLLYDWRWVAGIISVSLGILFLIFTFNRNQTLNSLLEHSVWKGSFSFDGEHQLPALLKIGSIDSSHVDATYRTEDKFEWNLNGKRIGDHIEFDFASTDQESVKKLVGIGKLICRISDTEMQVVFSDISDHSTVQFTMHRVEQNPNSLRRYFFASNYC